MALPLSQARGLPLSFIFKQKDMASALIRESLRKPEENIFTMRLPGRVIAIATNTETAKDLLMRSDVFQKDSGIRPDGSLDPASRFLFPLSNVDGGRQRHDLVSVNGDQWARQRKVLNPAFATSALNNLVPVFSRNALTLLTEWEGKADGKQLVDGKASMSNYALDVLGCAVLGRPFGAQHESFKGTYDHYKNIMGAMIDPIYLIFPFLEYLPLPRNFKLKQSVDHMTGLLRGAVEERLREREVERGRGVSLEERPPRDLLDLLIPLTKDGAGLPLEELLPNMWIFFVAGHDTTGIALSWALRYLACFPEIQEKARAETLNVIGRNGVPGAEDISDEKVPYLSAFIKECLRLQPPVHNLLTRRAAVDTELGGYQIPMCTTASVAIAAINRDPRSWGEDSFQFRPERFIENPKTPSPFKWIPFSAGSRRCLGDRFSLMEQKTMLMMILSRFAILGQHDDMTGQMNEENIVRSRGGLEVLLNPPNDAHIRLKKLADL